MLLDYIHDSMDFFLTLTHDLMLVLKNLYVRHIFSCYINYKLVFYTYLFPFFQVRTVNHCVIHVIF